MTQDSVKFIGSFDIERPMPTSTRYRPFLVKDKDFNHFTPLDYETMRGFVSKQVPKCVHVFSSMQGSRIKNWKKRYMVLHGKFIFYFKTPLVCPNSLA